MVVRVDRTDLSKNTLRGFKAFDVFLDRHPEFREDITFFALLQPTRQDVDEYVEYLAKIRDVVSHVNLKHGTPDWMPIDLRIESNINRAVAAYKHYDVLVVNPIFDGMNLIAKEAPLVNERDGVLILSENAGAHEELGAYAITINPFDVDAQAEALHQALTMPHDERAFRQPGDQADRARERRRQVARRPAGGHQPQARRRPAPQPQGRARERRAGAHPPRRARRGPDGGRRPQAADPAPGGGRGDRADGPRDRAGDVRRRRSRRATRPRWRGSRGSWPPSAPPS